MYQSNTKPRFNWRYRHAILFTMLGLSACGGSDGSSTNNNNTSTPKPPTEVSAFADLKKPLGAEDSSCRLKLSKNSANFAESITVTGIPATFKESSIRVLGTDNNKTHIAPAFFSQNDDNTVFQFVAPIHPATPFQGGTVMLEIGDGKHHCPQVELNVAAVPKADPKQLTRVNQKIEQWLDLTIQQLGADPAQLLIATADTILPELIPFAVAKRSLAEKGYLTQQAQQAITNNDQLLAGVIQASQLEKQLDTAIAELKALPMPTERRDTLKLASQANTVAQTKAAPINTAELLRNNIQAQPLMMPVQAATMANACAGQELAPKPLAIHSASELSKRMLAASKGNLFNGKNQTSAGQALGTLALSGSSSANYAGGGLFIIKSIENAKKALEPKEITSFDVGTMDTLLLEDRPESQPGRWNNVTVNAKGEAFNISAAILDGFVTAVGMTSGPVGTIVTAGSTAFADQVGQGINTLTKDSCIRIAAPSYGSISVSDEEWTEFKVIGDTVKRLSQRTYIGQDIGNSELQFKLKTEKFASNRVFIEKRNVVVQEQQISLSPSNSKVDKPGATVEITASIPNAFTQKDNLKATIVRGGGLAGAQIINQGRRGGAYVVTVKTPEKRVFYPIHVEFEALNDTLPKDTRRTRLAYIDTKESLTLSSPNACLLPNTDFEITATIEGFTADKRGVDWHISGPGQLISTKANADGTQVTATIRSTGKGSINIEAAAKADSSISDSESANIDNRCLKKMMVVGMAIGGADSGLDSDGGEGCADHQSVDNFEDTYLSEENPILPPTLPPESKLWFDRTETVQVSNHNSNINIQREHPNGNSCISSSVNSLTNGKIQTISENDGTIGFDFDVNLSGSCVDTTNSGTPQAEIYCATSQAIVSANSFHYFDIDRDTKINISGEYQCGSLSGVAVLTPISVLAQRYEGGTAAYLPNDPLQDSLITDADGNNIVSVLWAGVTCSKPNEVLQLDKDIIFKAPRQTGQTDRIIINTIGGAYAAVNGTTKTGFGPFDATNPLNFIPKVGQYNTDAKVSFRFKATPK